MLKLTQRPIISLVIALNVLRSATVDLDGGLHYVTAKNLVPRCRNIHLTIDAVKKRHHLRFTYSMHDNSRK